MAVGYYPAEFKNWPVAQYWFMERYSHHAFCECNCSWTGAFGGGMRYKVRSAASRFIFRWYIPNWHRTTDAAPDSGLPSRPFVSFALAALFNLMQPFFTGVLPATGHLQISGLYQRRSGPVQSCSSFPLDGGGVLRAIVLGVTITCAGPPSSP